MSAEEEVTEEMIGELAKDLMASPADLLGAAATVLSVTVQLVADYGEDHYRKHGPIETLRQLREDANTAAEGLKSMREKHYAVTQERDDARKAVCWRACYGRPGQESAGDYTYARDAARDFGWGYLYPEEVEL